MSHSNGRIYIDTSGTTPIGIDPLADVSYVLGRSTGDYGQLCGDVNENGVKVSKVNVNSLHKPVRSSLKAVLTDAQFGAVNWGYRVPSSGDLSSLIGNINSEESGTTPSAWSPSSQGETNVNGYEYMRNGWWYQKPRGPISGEPFRIRDFNEYDATPDYLFKAEPARTTIDSGAFYMDMFTQLNLDTPQMAAFDELNGMMYLVAVVKKNANVSTARFKSAPASLSGSALYTVVEFTSAEVGNSNDGSKVFVGGTGDYYVYSFLVSRSYLDNNNNPVQNLDSAASNYRALNTMTGCIVLPIARQTVTFVSTPVVNPLDGLTFTFASGGTINYNPTSRRFTVNFPQLTATNTGSSKKSFANSNLYADIYLQKINDSSKAWESTKLNMGITGSTAVQSGSSAVVFSSKTLVITDTSVIEFMGNDNISEYAKSAIISYLDLDTGNYYPVATLDV